jgi:hypothetical protein
MLNLQKFNQYFFAFLLPFLCLFFLIKSCNYARERDMISDDLMVAKNEIAILQKWKENNQETAKQQVQTIYDANKIKEQKKLDNLETKVIFKTNTLFDTIKMTLLDTVFIGELDTIDIKKFDYLSEWLQMSGYVNEQNVMFDSIKIKNKFVIEVGTERKWLLGKKIRTIYIKNQNPYTSTDSITAFVIDDRKKWYENKPLMFISGGLATFLLFR